jgi:hypothetical protein
MISHLPNRSLSGMPTHQVNLDALIKREPMDSASDSSVLGHDPLFKLEELHHTKMYFRLLRKPDFQRETANWSPHMIEEFVRTFLDNGLIPAIIIWHSKATNNVFVIDGAHRVSALIAWVNDDYGAGEISNKAWGHAIPPAQAKFHKETKSLIDDSIGSYAQLYDFGLNPEKTSDLVKQRRGKAIATMQLYIQKVEGDAAVAEQSFYKINSNSVAIDDTELDMIKARKKPNAIAVRAILSKGKGFKYWEGFSNAKEIEAAASEGFELLFGETFDFGPKSPDLPRAGQPYSGEAFKMVLDLVNMFNGVTPAMWSHKAAAAKSRKSKKGAIVATPLADDADGSATLKFLNTIIDNAGIALGGSDRKGSLGLDQGVYAYGATGRVHSAAYLASLRLALELSQNNQLVDFSVVRKDFEDFLVRHKAFLNTLSGSKGSRTKPLQPILQMYKLVFRMMLEGERSDANIILHLQADPMLKDLSMPAPVEEETSRKKFGKSVVQTKLVLETLAGRRPCTICGARLPPYCRSKDHSQKQADGGLGDLENLDFTHPYCNNAKDAIEARRIVLEAKWNNAKDGMLKP